MVGGMGKSLRRRSGAGWWEGWNSKSEKEERSRMVGWMGKSLRRRNGV